MKVRWKREDVELDQDALKGEGLLPQRLSHFQVNQSTDTVTAGCTSLTIRTRCSTELMIESGSDGE